MPQPWPTGRFTDMITELRKMDDVAGGGVLTLPNNDSAGAGTNQWLRVSEFGSLSGPAVEGESPEREPAGQVRLDG